MSNPAYDGQTRRAFQLGCDVLHEESVRVVVAVAMQHYGPKEQRMVPSVAMDH